MKIRNGFVSNSSSSSFVLVGVKLSDITEKQRQLLEDNNFDELDDDENPEAIGVQLGYASDYETEEISFSDLNHARDNIKKLLNDVDVKVFFGERYG